MFRRPHTSTYPSPEGHLARQGQTSPLYKIFPTPIVHTPIQTHCNLAQRHWRSRSHSPIYPPAVHLHQTPGRTRRVSGLEVNPPPDLWSRRPVALIAGTVVESIRILDPSISKADALAPLSPIAPSVDSILLHAVRHAISQLHSPTFTAVLPSSSDARLPPPCLVPMLMRLELLCICMTALDGLCNTPGGEAGGELAIARRLSSDDEPDRTRYLSRSGLSYSRLSDTRAFCVLH